jgi:ABC-type dipeptide/oligopeptide/nickel transport system permease component
MTKYIAKRVLLMIVTLFIIMLLTFAIMHAVPGGPFTRDRQLMPQVEAQLNAKYNLDQPLPVQFFYYVRDLCCTATLARRSSTRANRSMILFAMDSPFRRCWAV